MAPQQPSPYLDPKHPAFENRPRTGKMSHDAAIKTMMSKGGGGLSRKEAEAVWDSLPADPTEDQVTKAMTRFRQGTSALRDAGYSDDLVRAVGTRLAADPNMTVEVALKDVQAANPDIRNEAQDASRAAGVKAPGGGTTDANGEFTGDGSNGATGADPDTQFLNQLRQQAQNFLTQADLQYLASVGSADSFISGAAASQQAAAANRQIVARAGELTDAGVPPGEIDRARAATGDTYIPFTPPSPEGIRTALSGGGDDTQRVTGMVPGGTPAADKIMAGATGGKTLTEAIRYIRDMSPSDLQNLQRKLVDAGYFAQIMSGQSFEPDVWGDPTDPATQEAWKTLLRDVVAQNSDVQTILAQRTGIWSSKLDEMRQNKSKAEADKADAERRKALADALQNQVTVTDSASLRTAAQKIEKQSAGMNVLTPAEREALAQWIQGIQAQAQRSAKQGASVAYDVDPVALMQQQIESEHPTEVLGQRAAEVGDEIQRLLAGPGR